MARKASDYRKAARLYRDAQQSRARQQDIDAAADAYHAATGDADKQVARDRLYELDPRHYIFTD